MRVYLGLGSNLGEKEQFLKRTLEELSHTKGITLVKVAPFYRSAPWGIKEQDWFLNTAVAVETTLSAEELLYMAKRIEESLGREASFRWGPRIIDIDILLYGEQTVDTHDLQIPHPYITERAFVLRPLLDLEPGLRHPRTRRPLREYWEALSDKDELQLWCEAPEMKTHEKSEENR